MCIDAPESTTNSLSSGLRVDARKHLFSEGEKNAALWCSYDLNTFLASFHAASRAPCSCHSVSSGDRSSNFGMLGFTWANISERRILVSNFGMTFNSLCEFHTLDWLQHVCALPENRLRRLHVLKYANLLPCIRWLTFRWILSQFLITLLPRFPSRSWHSSVTGSLSCQFPFFSKATALLSSSFLDLLVGCSSTWRCAYEHFYPNRQQLLVL